MGSARCGGFRDTDFGKFLVLRRDGTVPDWTWFVLGAADKNAPAALKAYSWEVRAPMCGEDNHRYADDVYKLSLAFEKERFMREEAGKKKGDPEAPPHRKDDRFVLALMSGRIAWSDIVDTLMYAVEAEPRDERHEAVAKIRDVVLDEPKENIK